MILREAKYLSDHRGGAASGAWLNVGDVGSDLGSLTAPRGGESLYGIGRRIGFTIWVCPHLGRSNLCKLSDTALATTSWTCFGASNRTEYLVGWTFTST